MQTVCFNRLHTEVICRFIFSQPIWTEQRLAGEVICNSEELRGCGCFARIEKLCCIVGTGLAPVRICYISHCGQPQGLSLRSHKFSDLIKPAPSDEGAVERSETEGEITKICYLLLSLPQSFFCEKRQLPRQREPVFIRLLHICGGSKPPPYRYNIAQPVGATFGRP